MNDYKNGKMDSYWRDRGEVLFFRDLYKAASYSKHLEFAAPRVYHTANRIIQHPMEFPQFYETSGFVLARIPHYVRSEPGNFLIHASHCEGHVCIYGATFVPLEQDARSVLGKDTEFTLELSSRWIKHCPRWAQHGEPSIV